MSHPYHWLKVTPEGLYCEPGDFYLDPLTPVAKAIITHAHSDHARAGHGAILATQPTIEIMKLRYGEYYAESDQIATYANPVKINDVVVTFYPAGHILGSAQIMLTYRDKRVIFSGDYKRQIDPTCDAFTVEPCDLFITEATFALPIFVHPPIEKELEKLLSSLKNFPERCHLLSAYVLGKCQRIIITLRQMGYDKPIYIHGAMQKMCQAYRAQGFKLGELILVDNDNAKQLQGELVICPPGALHDRWSRKLPQPLRANASGWMQIRARAKQLGVELPLIISDHADWQALRKTIRDIDAPEVWVTHGQEEALLYDGIAAGFKMKALAGLHYEDEIED